MSDAIEAARRIVDKATLPAKRPTVAELEAILQQPDAPPIHINPDGSIGAGVNDALVVARALLVQEESDPHEAGYIEAIEDAAKVADAASPETTPAEIAARIRDMVESDD